MNSMPRARITDLQGLQEKLSALKGIKIVSKSIRTVTASLRHGHADNAMFFQILQNDDGCSMSLLTNLHDQRSTDKISLACSKEEADRLEDILLARGAVYESLVDVIRDTFEYGSAAIIVSNIRDKGYFLEIHPLSPKDDDASIKTTALFTSLGIEESDFIT